MDPGVAGRHLDGPRAALAATREQPGGAAGVRDEQSAGTELRQRDGLEARRHALGARHLLRDRDAERVRQDEALRRPVELADDPEWATPEARLPKLDKMFQLIEEWSSRLSKWL